MQGTLIAPGARVYFLGIAGTAMGNLACALRQAGYAVSGSDANIYPPMSEVLAEAGIECFAGFDAARLAALEPDCVVVGNAASRGNPEVEWLLETRKIPFASMPETIGALLIGQRPSLVVAGTHGKTTTTALAAHLLCTSGAEPGWLLGGVPHDLPSGCHVGNATVPFVIEGDEYDSAFFDKRSKFVHYRPRVLCLNNLEFDHADIFRDLDDIRRSFNHVTRLVPASGAILFNGDDLELRNLADTPWCRRFSVGTVENCDLRIAEFAETSTGSAFRLLWKGAPWVEIRWPLHGLFNARNAAMAALGTTLIQGKEPADHPPPPEAFAAFRGVRRRQQVLVETESVVLIEDFAHHPTAIAGTLEALHAARPGHRLLAAFEPRSNTARSAYFQEAFATALSGADVVLLAPVVGGEGRVENAVRLDPQQLAADLQRTGTTATACASFDALATTARQAFQQATPEAPLQAVLFTNGAFGGILPGLVSALS
ncbi:MAG: UDP-N-acetylmuramate--L-alanine ligase [Opitutales bacterium]